MLTRKQIQLLEFIQVRMARDGVPPSFDEMKLALDLRSKSGIHRLVTALEERGFIRRLHEGEGTWLGHVLEHVAIELQNVAGTPVTFGKTRGTGDPGEYFVVYEYEQSEVGLEAGQLGLQLLHSLLPPELRPADFDAEHFDFQRRRDRCRIRARRRR